MNAFGKYRTILFLILALLGSSRLSAQELNCQVTVLAPKATESDRSIYSTLQVALRDFINSRKWTNDQFLNQERIECSMTITISDRVAVDEFKASIQIQSRRPVYRSSYFSPIFNHQDNDFNFRYIQDQVLDIDEGNITSNLMAVIAYYCYVVVGFDYDSYSLEGGTPSWLRAQAIVNSAQGFPERGWKAFEGTRNRYWLIENMLHAQFKGLRSCEYKYHRLGFDQMNDNVTEGRASVLSALKELRQVYNNRPNSFAMQVFFNAKADEIVSLFTQGTSDEKTQLLTLLTLIDPANTFKYETINGSK